MGRRRKKYRKRISLRPQPRLPTIFDCPNCGARMMTVTIDKKRRHGRTVVAVITCGKCGLYAEMEVPDIYAPVDVYSKFLDAFLEGRIEYKFKGGESGEAEVSLSELAEEGGEGEEGVETGEG